MIGVDNFSAGHQSNLDAIRGSVGPDFWANFEFIEENVENLGTQDDLFERSEIILHHAALGSVPLSFEEPDRTFRSNVLGAHVVFEGARKAGIKKVVYASSSAVYGDEPSDVKIESRMGQALSPYAYSKLMNEQQADQYSKCFGTSCVGFRYFNVFGPRQSPDGPYAAVIPAWIRAIKAGAAPKVFGNGEQTRDFVFISDIVKANFLAALKQDSEPGHAIYNIGQGDSCSLISLYKAMRAASLELGQGSDLKELEFGEARSGDIVHSRADISKVTSELGFQADCSLTEGLAETLSSS